MAYSGAAFVALVLGLISVKHPTLALICAAGAGLAGLLAVVPVRAVIAATLIYLPFQEIVLTYLPARLTAPARFAPEAVADAVAIGILCLRGNELLRRASRGVAVFAGVSAVWLLGAIWNGVGATTALYGFRAEFRYVSLAVIAVLSTTPGRDRRLYARIVVLAAVVQAAAGMFEAVGGAAVRRLLAPQWSVYVGGLQVSGGETGRVDRVFGTFSNHNELGIFLAFAFLVLVAAGSEGLGWTPRRTRTAGWLIGMVLILSGSRESAVATVVGLLIIARIRHRLALRVVVPLAVALLLAALPLAEPLSRTAPNGSKSYAGVTTRWAQLLSPATWAGNVNSNFRLYLLKSNATLVAHESPVFGFGLGTVTDKRVVAAGASPITQTAAGVRATEFSYVYDGNWDLLILEVGFAGLAAVGALFVAIHRLARRDGNWCGLAAASLGIATVVLGFFASILQLALPMAIFWLLIGFGLARDESAPLPAAVRTQS